MTDAPDSKPEGWEASLLEVFREVLHKLPDETSLGELVQATQANPHIAPVLQILSVQELIDLAAKRPRIGKKSAAPDGPVDDGTMVIRRRADVPDGDLRILNVLSDHASPLSEGDIAQHSRLSEDQVRLIVRQLSAKGLAVVEGSAARRRIRITRSGQYHLRKQGQNPQEDPQD